jgi:hypothetical protein
MHNPFWVASARAGGQKLAAFGNHTCAFGVEEGRTGPDHACLRDARLIKPLTRPVTAKSASSQGEALASAKCAPPPTHSQTQLKDMKMEFLHD